MVGICAGAAVSGGRPRGLAWRMRLSGPGWCGDGSVRLKTVRGDRVDALLRGRNSAGLARRGDSVDERTGAKAARRQGAEGRRLRGADPAPEAEWKGALAARTVGAQELRLVGRSEGRPVRWLRPRKMEFSGEGGHGGCVQGTTPPEASSLARTAQAGYLPVGVRPSAERARALGFVRCYASSYPSLCLANSMTVSGRKDGALGPRRPNRYV